MKNKMSMDFVRDDSIKENCTHENAYLMGTANGIVCRRCGQVFARFADVHPAPKPEADQAQDEPTTKD